MNMKIKQQTINNALKRLFERFKTNRPIGPLQLAVHVVQNRHAGEQKSH